MVHYMSKTCRDKLKIIGFGRTSSNGGAHCKGICVRKDFFTASIHNYKWEIRVMNVQNCSETKVEFCSISEGKNQQTFHIKNISINYISITSKLVITQ